MNRTFTARIALRYLRSKKSHSAVGAISAVSIIGMAVATAAIVCVLSVFNGFREVITDRLDSISPDIMIEPAKGKVIANSDSLASTIKTLSHITEATPTLSDNALVIYQGHEMPVYLKGVDPEAYSRTISIKSLIRKDEGHYLTTERIGNKGESTLSIGVASSLQIYPGEEFLLFAPKREGRVNMANPMNSFLTDSLIVSGIFQSQQTNYDENRIIVDLSTARRLFQYSQEASAIEIKVTKDANIASVASQLQKYLGSEYIVKDRLRQQDTNFKMVEIEKWVTFLLMGFILMIAGFNIISTLSMLVLEKQDSLLTLSSMGLCRKRIGHVFAWESIFVALIGGIAGIMLGVTLCWLQMEFGLIKIGDGENTIISAYPVKIKLLDLFITIIPVLIIGLITAVITAQFARRRLNGR